MTKFYVTTAIDYVNAAPHIGHAYQKIVADVLARWHKLKGDEVFFVTGTDEHGKKVQRAAKAAGKPTQKFVDETVIKFKEAWKSLNILPDRFIRTTDEDHKKVVKKFIEKCDKAGKIYLGEYEGYYCTDCEAYYTEKDAPDFICPIHKKKLEKLKEKSYFFKLSEYKEFLLDLYKKHPEFILPKSRRNEVISRVKDGLQDLSISRTSFDWGIPFPLDKKHVTYVWFDALINYYTATRKKGKEKFWPADVHLLGKDNSWFHCVYWPAMLKSVGIKLPKTVFVHGFLKFNGQKISKSLGNVISPKTLVEKYSADAVRYFCLRHFPFGEDGDFDEKALVARHNNELANKLGNLVSRVSGLIEKDVLKKVGVDIHISNVVRNISELIDQFKFDKALNEIFAFIDTLNQFVQDKKLWENKDEKDIYELVSGIRVVTVLLWPFIPETSEKIAKRFGFKISLEELKKPLKTTKIKKGEILFKKI